MSMTGIDIDAIISTFSKDEISKFDTIVKAMMVGDFKRAERLKTVLTIEERYNLIFYMARCEIPTYDELSDGQGQIAVLYSIMNTSRSRLLIESFSRENPPPSPPPCTPPRTPPILMRSNANSNTKTQYIGINDKEPEDPIPKKTSFKSIFKGFF